MRRAVVTTGVASLACVVAVFRYPGGTAIEHGTTSYSLTRNFLSDLGMTVAHNGQANRLGASLFVVSMMTLVFGAIASLAPLMRDLMRVPAARPWIRAVGVCLLVASIAFTGVAFTPENRAMRSHVNFTVWGWRVVAALTLLLGVAALRAGKRYQRVAIIALAAGAVLAAYAATFIWGPTCCSTAASLTFHVVAQKCAAIVVVATVLAIATHSVRIRP